MIVILEKDSILWRCQSPMTNLSSTGLTVLAPFISPDFHSWEDHFSLIFHSEDFDELDSNTGLTVPVCCTFNELRGTFWLSDLVFSKLSDAVEANTFGSFTLYRKTKFIIGFDFAVTLSSPASSCVLFDIASRLLMELKWLMLNKHKRWFHSSHVKFPFVNMSASWFLVSMYLIWILGSKLILSNNQSRATLCVLETCLIVGLLPFIIILINASLSSKTYNKASWWKNVTFEGINQHYPNHWSLSEIACVFELCEVVNELDVYSLTSRPVLFGSDSCSQELRRSDPINQVRVYHPKRNDLWFCWAVINWRLFLTPPADWNKRMTSEKCIMFLQKWILNPQDLPQNSSLETVPICIRLQCFPHDNIVCIHMYDEYMKSIDSSVCHKLLVHFVIDRASLFTDHRISGRPTRAKYKHFKTIWEHVFDNFPTDFYSSSLKWWSSIQGVDTL